MMRLPKMDHCAPKSVEEASSLLKEHGPEAQVLAGGTDLLAACKLRNTRPALLVSLSGIEALRGIDFHKGEGLRIGAMTLRARPPWGRSTTVSRMFGSAPSRLSC